MGDAICFFCGVVLDKMLADTVYYQDVEVYSCKSCKRQYYDAQYLFVKNRKKGGDA